MLRRFISICTDIWSKPGMTVSFLGITVHYFSHQDSQHHNVTLAPLVDGHHHTLLTEYWKHSIQSCANGIYQNAEF